jgi:hypothetical protein
MPKATWGSDIDQEAIDSAETGRVYTGEMPKAGPYRFKLKTLQKGTSKADNPKVKVVAFLDGSWKPEHEVYDGCPLFIDVPVMKDTAWRVKALCEGLGVTSTEFLKQMTVDGDGNIQKIGSKVINEKTTIYVNVRTGHNQDGDDRLEPRGPGFLPAPSESDGDDAAAEAKPKKSKKSKGKAEEPAPF